jgi:hypothetical protein
MRLQLARVLKTVNSFLGECKQIEAIELIRRLKVPPMRKIDAV